MLSHLILREKRNSDGLAGERSFHSRGGGLGGNPTAGLPAAPANSSPPFLKERAVKPGGLDPSAAMLARARTGVSCPLHWVYTEADRIGLGDARFDLTFCVDVVHHVNNRVAQNLLG
jgi:Methyltransferase domain